MNRKVVVALCTLALVTSAVAAGKREALGEAMRTRFLAAPAAPAAPVPQQQPAPGRPAGATPQQAQPAQQPAPAHAVYNEFFYHVNFLRKKAAKEEAAGKQAGLLRSFYKRQAKLDEAQNGLIDKTASDLGAALERMDEKARKIILKFRADVRAMDIKPGQRPPDPPAELKAMQAERDALILRARDGLRASLGGEAFGRLDQYVQQNIAPRMTAAGLGRQLPENPNQPR